MSIVSYFVQQQKFGFASNLKFTNEDKMFELEEKLMIEVTEHKKYLRPSIKGSVHDIEFTDDSGIKFFAKDFSEIGNLKIDNNETH